ncbi:2TM domain-containing protein [Telluribacter humicola]|uniref:2TM domain-containing protein n=1 Tax=Telluribacter humicola TaxID=1720261 RepID=UPI001A96CBE7|nr:2TM domain-containing protein [Telluribacter humicola]
MENRNERLWRLARLRAKFKNNVIAYCIVNPFLIAIWYFSSGGDSFFWPGFPLFFWGIGLVFEGYNAYYSKGDLVEREYQKLLKEQR